MAKAIKLKSGSWRVQVYHYKDEAGKNHYKSFTAPTKAEAEYMAAQFRKEKKKETPVEPDTRLTLTEAIDNYIETKSNILSPSTIRGYRYVQKSHFQEVMDAPLQDISNWQELVNHEAREYSAKTVKNCFNLICSILRDNGMPVPKINLPQVVKNELPWLSYDQIPTFLAAIQGSPCELEALLALHSLRRSEILALTKANCSDGIIRVRGSAVVGEDGKLEFKITNKNTSSNRDVPIMIPRLQELIDLAPDGRLIRQGLTAPRQQINRICAANNLPEVGIHGLRRSFASLAYHLGLSERETMDMGGWSDRNTMHNFYIKLDQQERVKSVNKMSDFYNNITQKYHTEAESK